MNGQRVVVVPGVEPTKIIISDDFTNPTVIYELSADAGTATSATGWKIKRTTITGTTQVDEQHAAGDSGYSHVADLYLAYSYS